MPLEYLDQGWREWDLTDCACGALLEWLVLVNAFS
jgi:hypothetical protein